MQELTLKAPAKINLYLNVLSKREDGYHEIESLAQSINICDIMHFEKIRRGIQIQSDHPRLPPEGNNLIYRAAQLFFELTGLNSGIKITLQKQIPVGGGLGGGSSNAATTLLGLNRLFETNLCLSDLMTYSEKLGTDIPFCLIGGTALLKGKGERVYPLPSIKEGWLVVVYPGIPVSTSWVYSQLNSRLTLGGSRVKLNIEKVKKKLANGRLLEIKDLLYNKLEEVTIERFPVLGSIKEEMRKKGAAGVLMSGSGSTVFGLVENMKEGKKLVSELKEKGVTFLTQPTARKED